MLLIPARCKDLSSSLSASLSCAWGACNIIYNKLTSRLTMTQCATHSQPRSLWLYATHAIYSLFHAFRSIRTAVAPSLSLDQRHGTCSKTICVSRTCKLTVFVVHWRRVFLISARHIERIRGTFCDEALHKLTFTLTFTRTDSHRVVAKFDIFQVISSHIMKTGRRISIAITTSTVKSCIKSGGD